MLKAIGHFCLIKIWGWKVVGDFPRDINKYIVLGGPHTSNWDFILAVFEIWRSGLRMTIIGKQELFNFFTRRIMKALNVVPVDRKKNSNYVDAVVATFDEHEEFRMLLAPEGTRKRVSRLKSGFYYIAKGANIPIVVVGAHRPTKTITILPPLYPTDDKDADFKIIYDFYNQQIGFVPENSFKSIDN